MRGFLLDTSAVSAFAPDKPEVSQAVAEWMRERAATLHLSAVTFLEVEQGLAKLGRIGAQARAERLSAWLDRMLTHYGTRVIGVDPPLARAAGELADRAISAGRHPGLADILIGATALHHSLQLVTRNLKHFRPLGIDCLDPFEAAS